MQRYIIIVCVLVFAVVSHASAQNYQDVVYLKDGSIIRGIIIEQIPNDSLKIQVEGGSLFVFKMSDVLKITKELTMVQTALKNKKNPVVSFALSFLVVGTGQMYNGEREKATLHWAVAGVSIALIYFGLEDNRAGRSDPDGDNDIAMFGIIAALSNWIYSMVEAPISAERINAERQNNPGSSIIDNRLMLEPYTSRETRGAMLSLRF